MRWRRPPAAHRRCAAARLSPCPRRSPACRWRAGSEGRRQDHRFLFLAVVGIAEIDSVFVDVAQKHRGDFGQLGFGVPVSGGVIAVDVAEVALAVDQRVALDEILRQSHQRVVDRGIAMRVVLTDNLTDDGRAFAGAGAGVDLELAHGVEHPPLDRQAVTHIGQGARHDGRQGVGKIALERAAPKFTSRMSPPSLFSRSSLSAGPDITHLSQKECA